MSYDSGLTELVNALYATAERLCAQALQTADQAERRRLLRQAASATLDAERLQAVKEK